MASAAAVNKDVNAIPFGEVIRSVMSCRRLPIRVVEWAGN